MVPDGKPPGLLTLRYGRGDVAVDVPDGNGPAGLPTLRYDRGDDCRFRLLREPARAGRHERGAAREDDMAIGESLLPEFDQEIAGARKTLERVPADKFDWRPHPKSGTMIWLAGHLANLPSWAPITINRDELDMAPGGKPMAPPPTPADTAELVATFDRHAAEARAAIAGASDADLLKPWSLLNDGTILMTLPKVAVLRGFVMNHLIHHRAQLGVYLRLNDVSVPSLYGPSADEAPEGF